MPRLSRHTCCATFLCPWPCQCSTAAILQVQPCSSGQQGQDCFCPPPEQVQAHTSLSESTRCGNFLCQAMTGLCIPPAFAAVQQWPPHLRPPPDRRSRLLSLRDRSLRSRLLALRDVSLRGESLRRLRLRRDPFRGGVGLLLRFRFSLHGQHRSPSADTGTDTGCQRAPAICCASAKPYTGNTCRNWWGTAWAQQCGWT